MASEPRKEKLVWGSAQHIAQQGAAADLSDLRNQTGLSTHETARLLGGKPKGWANGMAVWRFENLFGWDKGKWSFVGQNIRMDKYLDLIRFYLEPVRKDQAQAHPALALLKDGALAETIAEQKPNRELMLYQYVALRRNDARFGLISLSHPVAQWAKYVFNKGEQELPREEARKQIAEAGETVAPGARANQRGQSASRRPDSAVGKQPLAP